MRYQFGDQDLAAQRLEVVARVFEATTRQLLEAADPQPDALAVDLGCGPGFTTRLLADVLDCKTVVGLDTSGRFLAMARRPDSSRLRFHLHDVLSTPFPEAPADLLFCRFLLSHLPEPASCLKTWATQLSPNGLLVIEEVEAIETTQAVFGRYLGIVESMLQSQGTELYVGGALEPLVDPPLLRRRWSRAQRFPVSNRDAATMFSMNVPNWKDRPFVRENFGAESIQDLEAGLRDLANAENTESAITWTLRQMIFERHDGLETDSSAGLLCSRGLKHVGWALLLIV
jgi:SAM-dependent methyltransferase